MNITLREFAESLNEIPNFGPTKLVRFLRREGFLKKLSRGSEPTEKARGLLDARKAPTTNRSFHPQVLVTEDGVRVFTDMIRAEYEDFGPWEIRSNHRD